MTTMATTFSNHHYWNNDSSIELSDYDDLFSSAFDCIHDDRYDQDFMSNTKQYEEAILSSAIDSQKLQILPSASLLSDVVCGVCGAPATGYNFDQITCESCKAFFRRNALRYMPNLKCRFSGSCVININTRRQCTYCRLKKCFDIKMRKDWIRTKEEMKLRQLQKFIKEQSKFSKLINEPEPFFNLPIVLRKKKRLLIKPIVQELVVNPIFTQTFFGFNRNLNDEDHVLLNNITNAYQLAADNADGFRINKCTESTTLIQFINDESEIHQSLIYFYKGIPEFRQLDTDEQVSLIKSNLVNAINLHDILIQNFKEDPQIGVCMSKWISEDFHYQMSRTREYFYRFMKHPLILKLALVIFIFSIHETDDYRNKIKVLRIQDFYTALLWRYLNYLFEETEAIRSMTIISTQILHFQSLMDIMEKSVKKEREDRISNELMQSVFRLTS